jgi:hypothetical protein
MMPSKRDDHRRKLRTYGKFIITSLSNKPDTSKYSATREKKTITSGDNMKSFKLFLSIFVLGILISTPASGAHKFPQEDCCFQIWAAGCNLGWATSLMSYTRSRESWVPADQSIRDFILRGGEQIRISNDRCGMYPEAWSGWQYLNASLQRTADSFSQQPNSNHRNQIWNYLKETFFWGTYLRIAVVGKTDKKIKTDTCSEKYFELGWLIAYTQQTLKVADETLRRGNSGWENQVEDAKKNMSYAGYILQEYKKLRPITGRCVRLEDIEASKNLSGLMRLNTTPANLTQMIRVIDWLQATLQERMLADCPSTANNQRRLPVNPPPAIRAPANQLPPPTATTIPPTSPCKCEDRYGGGIEYFLVRDGRVIKRKLGWSECENLKKSHPQCK